MNTNKPCPAGWHVPAYTDWTIHSAYLGGYLVAGSKLNETGENHWLGTSSDATNESGFTALPGGFRNYNSYFFTITVRGYWWSAEYGTAGVWYTTTKDSGMYKMDVSNSAAFSVRCLRD